MENILKSVPIFAGIAPNILDYILSKLDKLSFNKGEIILKEGEIGDSMYIVEKGSARVVKNYDSDNETEIAIIEDKDFFGEMMLIEMVARSASIIANSDITLYRIRTSDIMSLIHHDIQSYAILILNIARDLCRRLRHIDEEYVKMKSK